MARTIKPLTDFLIRLGIERIDHSKKSYLAHLVGVYRDLEAWGCPEDVCAAGLFHSIYGTEIFQGFTLPLQQRHEVRALVGERAERLAFLNCFMDRPAFDRALEQETGPWRIVLRGSREEVELPRADFDDLCRVHLCDWLEQVPRDRNWSYRRSAYQKMAERLGGVAKEAHERAFAAATA